MRREIKLNHWVMPGLSNLSLVKGDYKKMEAITQIVCKHFALSIDDVRSKNRGRPYVDARSIAMYFTFKKTQMYLTAIGKYFNRDHSTIIYARSKVENLMFSSRKFNNTVQEIEKLL